MEGRLLGQRIRITAGAMQAEGELADNGTGRMVAEALPISGSARTWGDEIYFPIPVEAELEDGKEVVEMGDLGYWPPGNAFCIFFGPTPASRGAEIRPASAVTIIGRVEGDATVFMGVVSGEAVLVETVG